MSKPPFNAARRTGTLPKKYTLTKPENRKDINVRLGIADFFPLDSNSPEDCLKQRTITEGFLEPKYVNDESSSMRKQMTGGMTTELKGQLLHAIYETEWRRSVIKGDFASSPVPSSTPTIPSASTGSGSAVTGAGAGAVGGIKRGPPFPDQVGVSPAAQKQWIARLAGSEPLSKLALQVPHTSKGDPLLKILLEANVPVLRATWYIKIIYLNMLRATKKSIDPPTEWTTTLTKFLASLIKEGDTHPTASRGGLPGGVTTTTGPTQKHTKLAYVIKLIRWNYSEGLLDREMFLGHMTDQLHDSIRAEDGHVLAHILYPYLPDVVSSPVLARRLYTTCTAKRTKLAPTLSASIIARMLDNVLADMIKYLSSATDSQFGSNPDSVYTPHTPRTPHTPHAQSSVAMSNVESDASSFDVPKLAEALDAAILTTDLDELYSIIFPASLLETSVSTNPSTPVNTTTPSTSLTSVLSTRHISRRVLLLCEWAVTPYRKNAYAVHIVTSVLSRYLKTYHPYLLNSVKSPFQVFLLEFLEAFVAQNASENRSVESPSTVTPMEVDGTTTNAKTKSTNNDTLHNVARLFGELQRSGIFSHDSYVRYLISRGRLEGVENGNHLKILLELPVGERGLDWKPRPRALHERNQRRAALLPHLLSPALPPLQPVAMALLDSILLNTPNLKDHMEVVVNSSVYEQYCISEWLALAVMHSVEPSAAPQPPPPVLFSRLATNHLPTATSPQFSHLTLESSLRVIQAVKNYYILVRLLLWLLTRTLHPGYLHVALVMVRVCDEAFAAMEMLGELFDALARVGSSKTSDHPPITNLANVLLTELLAKNRDTALYRKWTEENPALAPVQACSTASQPQSSANILPHTLAQIRTVLANTGPVPDSVEQIVKSNFSLDKIATACLQLFAIKNEDSSRSYAHHVGLLFSLAEPTPAKLGNTLKQVLSSYLQTLSSPANLSAVGELLTRLVVSFVLPLDQLLQYTILPMLHESVINITPTQSPHSLTHKVEQVSTIASLVLVLFGLEHPSPKPALDSQTINDRAQLRVCVRDRKCACLLLAFPLITTLYNLLAHFHTKFGADQCEQRVLDTARVAVETLLSDEDMVLLCLHHATTIYSHLKGFDSHTRRKIFNIMHDSCPTDRSQPDLMTDSLPAPCSSRFPPLTLENMSTLGPSLVLAALQCIKPAGRGSREGEGWCVDRVWLELQLVFDEWALVEPTAGYQGVRILLSHFATNNNWVIHPVFSWLLRRMGAEFQTHLIRATLSILEEQCNSLHQLPASLASLAIGPFLAAAYPETFKSRLRKNDDPNSEDSDTDDDGICRGLGRLVSRCLESAPIDVCVECVNQLCAQLQVFSDSSPYLDSLSLPIGSLQAAQRSICLRISMFMSAYARSSSLPPLANGAGPTASPFDASVRTTFPHTLLALAARPLITCDNDVLLQVLAALQQLTQTEPNDPCPPPFKKLADQYSKLRPTLPSSARIHIQKSLSFLTPGPVPPPLHNASTNSWTMLEDYPDAPLSPSQWGGVRVERMEPAYAKVAFAHAEPPPP